MIIKKTIFSIPIYICSQSDFHKRIEQKRKKDKEEYKKTHAFKKMGIPYEYSYKKDEWKYDKIIGWIEIYLNGKTIKADYWFIKAKKISINIKNKQFEYRNKICDISDTHRKTNKEIIEDIKLFLSNCQGGKHIKFLRRYYIYTSELFALLNHIDIKNLVEYLNHGSKNLQK